MKRRYVLSIVGVCALLIAVLASRSWLNPGRSTHWTPLSRFLARVGQHFERVALDIELKKEALARAELENAFNSGKAVRIRLPQRDVSSGEWMRLEQAVGAFARSNRIEIIQFENGGQIHANVCVWAKDAPKMQRFIDSTIVSLPKVGE